MGSNGQKKQQYLAKNANFGQNLAHLVQGGAETVRQLGASRGGGPAGGRGGPVGGRGGPVRGQGGQVGDQPRAGGQRRARGQ